MISARFILKTGLACLGIAALGAGLLFWAGLGWGKYLVMAGVTIGALSVFIGVIAGFIGELEDDLRGPGKVR